MLALFRELALGCGMLPAQLAHDQENHADHDDDRRCGGKKLQPGLRPPIMQRGRGLGGRDDQDREVLQRLDRADLVIQKSLAGEASRNVAVHRERTLKPGRVRDVLADQPVVLGIAGDDGAVAVNHRNRGAVVQRQRCDEIFEVGRFDAADGKADDLALAADDLSRKHRRPDLGHLAHDRLDDHVGGRLARHELPEVAPVSDGAVGHRPHLGRIDQCALGAPQIQGADIRQHRELRAQQLVRAQCRHLALEVVGGVDPVRPQAGHDVFLDMLEVQQLLVEMPRQQQRAVVQFAFGDFQRPLAVLHGEIAGAQHDRDHERCRTQDQPLDGAQPDPPRHAGAEQRPPLRDHFLR